MLTDPYYFFSPAEASVSRLYPPNPVGPESFGRIDFVYCSHIHTDHTHPRTLAALRPHIGTLLIPGAKPALERVVRKLGFNDVMLLDDGERTELAQGLTITSHAHENQIDSAAVIEMDGATVLHANDCILSAEQLESIRERTPVDYAFMPHSCVQDLYPALLPRTLDEKIALGAAREREQVPLLVDSVRTLRPQVLIPYSFTVAYLNHDQLALNAIGRTMQHEFVDAVRSVVPDQECRILGPGDSVDTKNRRFKIASDNPFGRTVAEHVERLRAFSTTEEGHSERFNFGDPDACDGALRHHFRKDKLWWKPLPWLRSEVVGIHVQGEERSRSYYFDFAARELSAEPPRAPQFEVTVPAAYLGEVLAKREDPYMGLYMQRVEFRMKGTPMADARAEASFYEHAFVWLFG